MTTEMKALIARIEAGETGRVIDVHAYWATHSGKLPYSTKFPPRYSTSLDAVMALKDEVLPQARWKFVKQHRCSDSFGAALTDYSSFDAYCEAPTECGVRLACLLKATAILKAKEAGNV